MQSITEIILISLTLQIGKNGMKNDLMEAKL